jgi:hypothetical protein
MSDVILAPDVLVNASVAPGTAPEQVVNRVLRGTQKSKSSEWIVGRVAAMLGGIPAFKPEAIAQQVKTIRGFLDVVDKRDYPADAWKAALVAAAKAAAGKRVITDHPDLVDKESEGVEFISTEAWLVERTMPPPMPPK